MCVFNKGKYVYFIILIAFLSIDFYEYFISRAFNFSCCCISNC